MQYRATTHSEREALTLRGCYAEVWDDVLVSDDFEVTQLRNTRFEGRVTIGSKSRITDSTIANYPTSFVSLFIFCILSYLLLKTMG